MKIRKASLKDVNNIFQLMKLNKELKNSTNCSYFDKKFLKTIITDKGIIFLVVEDNKKVLGVLGAAVWKKEKICYADFIFIDKRYRGKGVGLELHKYFIKNLKKEGIKYLWAIVKSDDYALQNTFKKFNMKKQYLCYYYDQELK